MKLRTSALIMLLVLVTPVMAMNWNDIGNVISGGGGLMAVVPPGQHYTKTFSIDTTGISYTNSCYDENNYKGGQCIYLHAAYIIMPEDCHDASCAIAKWSSPLQTLPNPVTITVDYVTTVADVGKKYGVTVFIARSDMLYDWNTDTWKGTTYILEGTQQGDTVEVKNAPIPPIPNILQQIIDAIQNWFCTVLHWGCKVT